MTKEIANWSDESMFKAEHISAKRGPQVTMVAGPADPLGMIAYFAKAYQGKFPGQLEDISDADREYYIQDILKNVLGSPLETVQFSFHISGVTRGFTHQLVRQRVGAAYQQESMRFAVKEDFPVALPESLVHVKSRAERAEDFCKLMGWWGGAWGDFGTMDDPKWERALEQVTLSANKMERQRDTWEDAVSRLGETYNWLVEDGMPAEEARGLAPTNILTQVNYTSSLRGLLDHAGMRLCTQAQYEWKQVWQAMIQAMADYGTTQTYRTNDVASIKAGAVYSEIGDSDGNLASEVSSEWQYKAIANMFRPICFQTGKCKFGSDFDRYCNIRDQVNANAEINRPPNLWEQEYDLVRPDEVVSGYNFDNPQIARSDLGIPVFIPAIRREQWMHPDAARQKSGDWRSDEAKKNIEGRR